MIWKKIFYTTKISSDILKSVLRSDLFQPPLMQIETEYNV